MPREQDFEGLVAPGSREKAGLLAELGQYLNDWQQVTSGETRPHEAHARELNRGVAELQQRAIAVGFGGIAHHLAEYLRLLGAHADLSRLRTQLGILGELAAQARLTVSSTDQAYAAGSVPVHSAPVATNGLAPPPMITVARSLDPALANQLDRAQSQVSASPPVGRDARATRQPSLPPLPLAQASAANLPPPAPAVAAPMGPVAAGPFSVKKSMLGLHAFGGSRPRGNGAERPAPERAPLAAPNPSLLGLGSVAPAPARAQPNARESAPPPLVKSDLWGLPPIPAEVGGHAGSAPAEPREQRYGAPPSAPPWRSSSPAGGRKRISEAPARPLRVRRESGALGLWLGIGGAVALAGLAFTAFLLFGHRQPRVDPTAAPNGSWAGTGAASDSSAAPSARASLVDAPRERLLSDDERFMSLLAQVHGHGGTESPELRSLLNEQAALASKALSGKCADGSPTCKAWSDVRGLITGNRKSSVARRRRGSDTESTRAGWMVGLKMPGIPVEDDPRVLRVFEFYTENPVGRETFQSMLFRCGAYRDLIQSTLIRYDLPAELLALVFTESGCEPSAKSPVGAAGLWQMMPDTGRAYHLNIVDGTIDERFSPFKSTEAGIRMLADLRQKLGSWDLVFASYNLGPFGVLARLEKAGPDASFWDLVDADLLPEETANYSPTVDAIALILANLTRLKFAGVQIRAPQLTADLEVAGGTRLSLVARAAATSLAQLRSLNLDFSGDAVPVIPGGKIAVQVPKDVVWQARDSLKELIASKDQSDQCVPQTFDWGKQRFTPEMEQACLKRLGAAAAATPQ